MTLASTFMKGKTLRQRCKRSYDYLHVHDGVIVWNIRLRRDVHEWEEEALMTLLSKVNGVRGIGEGEDEIS